MEQLSYNKGFENDSLHDKYEMPSSLSYTYSAFHPLPKEEVE